MLFLLLFASCADTAYKNSMDKAEAFMETKPDSAMLILDSIDQDKLHSDKDRARYALLKSMALDKNWVDKTSFEVLQPAIDYYLNKGTADEKLKTYYYQGRIFQNQGKRDKAFGTFARALDVSEDCRDSLLLIRTLMAQGCTYQEIKLINLLNRIV